MRDMLDAIAGLQAAIENEGRYPQYHREILTRHRREWPTLWRAIDHVLELAQEGQGGTTGGTSGEQWWNPTPSIFNS